MFRLGVVSDEAVTRKTRVSLMIRFVCTDFSALHSLSVFIKMSSFFLLQWGAFHMGDLAPALKGKGGGQSILLLLPFSQTPSA